MTTIPQGQENPSLFPTGRMMTDLPTQSGRMIPPFVPWPSYSPETWGANPIAGSQPQMDPNTLMQLLQYMLGIGGGQKPQQQQTPDIGSMIGAP